MLTIKNLSVSIDGKTILNNINVEFQKGKVYAIMGPNGSGKSTLASTVMGHPVYEVDKKSKIIFNGEEIQEEDVHKRAEKGIFLSFQSPLSLSGVTIYQLLRYPLGGKIDPLDLRRKVQAYAKKLHIKEELLSRSLNDGFSGGERKKMEVLQAVMLNPSLIFFDEIDTGVDVDALKKISALINELRKEGKTIILITHYNRILKYIEPDGVYIIKNGEITATGGKDLAEHIESKGYEQKKAD